MGDEFDAAYVKELLKKQDTKEVDDVLMNQDIFSEVGNKIRNEALYRAGIHPLSITGKIPPAEITKLIKEVVKYAKLFYKELETKGELKSYTVYKQEFAPDGSEVTMKILPKSKRKIYYSEHKAEVVRITRMGRRKSMLVKNTNKIINEYQFPCTFFTYIYSINPLQWQ